MTPNQYAPEVPPTPAPYPAGHAIISPNQIHRDVLEVKEKVMALEYSMTKIERTIDARSPWYIKLGAVVGIVSGLAAMLGILSVLSRIVQVL